MTNSFEAVAREWHETIHLAKVSAGHAARTLIRLEQDVFPWLGGAPVGEIKPPELLQAMRRIEARGAVETAHRALQACGQVFRYAIATGRAERDPTPDLRGALKPVLVKHMAAITDPQRVGELLRAIVGYKGMPITRAARQLAPLVFVRPGELRKAEWVEFDIDAAQWRIPAASMKRTKQEKLSGTSLADFIAGQYAASGVLAALYERDGPQGRIAAQTHSVTTYLAAGVVPPRRGTEGNGGLPSQAFECADGGVIVICGSEPQYRSFCDVLGCPDLADDPRFVTNAQRLAHRRELAEGTTSRR